MTVLNTIACESSSIIINGIRNYNVRIYFFIFSKLSVIACESSNTIISINNSLMV